MLCHLHVKGGNTRAEEGYAAGGITEARMPSLLLEVGTEVRVSGRQVHIPLGVSNLVKSVLSQNQRKK